MALLLGAPVRGLIGVEELSLSCELSLSLNYILKINFFNLSGSVHAIGEMGDYYLILSVFDFLSLYHILLLAWTHLLVQEEVFLEWTWKTRLLLLQQKNTIV